MMHLSSRVTQGVAAFTLVAGAVVAWAVPTFANPGQRVHGPRPDQILYVSNLSAGSVAGPTALPAVGNWPAPSPSSDPRGCVNAPYTPIGAAVSAAAAGQTIAVCPGAYPEDVIVPVGKPLTIEGIGNPI